MAPSTQADSPAMCCPANGELAGAQAKEGPYACVAGLSSLLRSSFKKQPPCKSGRRLELASPMTASNSCSVAVIEDDARHQVADHFTAVVTPATIDSALDDCLDGQFREHVDCLVYKNSREAMAEVSLEGGEGDPVLFQRVRAGSSAEVAGVQSGDEVVRVNAADPQLLFQRPADEILPSTRGPVLLFWRRSPRQREGERTRIHKRRPKNWEELEDDGFWCEEYPKSKAEPLDAARWLCGSCCVTNFDVQEYCRCCGLRDSRLPVRPGLPPRSTQENGIAPLLFAPEGLSDRDIQEAAAAGTGNDFENEAPLASRSN